MSRRSRGSGGVNKGVTEVVEGGQTTRIRIKDIWKQQIKKKSNISGL